MKGAHQGEHITDHQPEDGPRSQPGDCLQTVDDHSSESDSCISNHLREIGTLPTNLGE